MKNLKILLIALVSVLLAGAMTYSTVAPANAIGNKGGGKITLKPTLVKAGGTITVKGTGFKVPVVYVVQCSKVDGKYCSTANKPAWKPVIARPNVATGKFTAKIKVKPGKMGKGVCKPHGKCLIVAATATGTVGAGAAFKFK